jgi:membrane associated rhomboid family serine protease
MGAPVREEERSLSTTLRSNAGALGGVTAVLWSVQLLNALLGHSLDSFGVVPRSLGGLAGIALAPFLHAGFFHLAMNTVSLWILGGLTMVRRQADFWVVALVSAITAGLGAWLFGGSGTVHIGASGVIFGFLGFLLGRGVFEPSTRTVVLALGVLWITGGMAMSMLPLVNPGVSWQAHLFGFLGGLLVSRVLAVARAEPRRIGLSG